MIVADTKSCRDASGLLKTHLLFISLAEIIKSQNLRQNAEEPNKKEVLPVVGRVLSSRDSSLNIEQLYW